MKNPYSVGQSKAWPGRSTEIERLNHSCLQQDSRIGCGISAAGAPNRASLAFACTSGTSQIFPSSSIGLRTWMPRIQLSKGMPWSGHSLAPETGAIQQRNVNTSREYALRLGRAQYFGDRVHLAHRSAKRRLRSATTVRSNGTQNQQSGSGVRRPVRDQPSDYLDVGLSGPRVLRRDHERIAGRSLLNCLPTRVLFLFTREWVGGPHTTDFPNTSSGIKGTRAHALVEDDIHLDPRRLPAVLEDGPQPENSTTRLSWTPTFQPKHETPSVGRDHAYLISAPAIHDYWWRTFLFTNDKA